MNWLIKALVTGFSSFAATNIDDIVILTLFFGQAKKRRWPIVAGQYLGFAAIVAISLVGYFARFIASPASIGILGFVPILLGIRALLKRDKSQLKGESSAGVFSVAAVTFANGGDNIGIYTPLFATSSFAELIVIVTVFLAMLAIWCMAGYLIGNRAGLQKLINRFGHIMVPFVLITLGIYILIENGTLALITSKL